jgi:oxygen-independent coproporphyrinogen-3 oxidase
MLAFGPGAYGWLTGNETRFVQTHNESNIARYYQLLESDSLPLSHGREITGIQAIATALGFAFKSNQPIKVKRFLQNFGVLLDKDEPFASLFAELANKGFISFTEDGQAVRPTLKGEALHEEIITVYFHQRLGSFSEPVCKR